MPYKKSRFNFTYRQGEDAYVVFNTYSKALVVLSSAEFEQFNAQHDCLAVCKKCPPRTC